MILSLLLLINAETHSYFGPIDFKESTGYLKRESSNSHVVALAKDFTAAKSYMDTLEETKSLKLNYDAELKTLGIDGARRLEGQGWLFQHNGYRTFLAVVKNTWKEIGNLKDKLQRFIDFHKSPLLKSAQPVPQKDIQLAELSQKDKENAKKIAELQSQNAQKEAKLAEFERKHTVFENQLHQKSQEIMNSHEKCTQKDAEIKMVNQRLEAITDRLNSEKEADRTKNQEEKAKLEKELEKLEIEKEELELKHDSLDAEKKTLEKTYKVLEIEKKSLEIDKESLKAEKEYVEQENESLAKQLNPVIKELYTVKTQQEQILNFWAALIDSTTAPQIIEPKEVKTWGCLLKKIENWSENQTNFIIKYEITNQQINNLYWNCLESMAKIEDTAQAASRIFYASLPVKEQLEDHASRVKYQTKLFAFCRQVIHLSTNGFVSAETITTFDKLIERIGSWKEYDKTIYIDAPFIKELYLKPKQDPYTKKDNGINQWLQGVNAEKEPIEDDGVRSIYSSVISIPNSLSSYEII